MSGAGTHEPLCAGREEWTSEYAASRAVAVRECGACPMVDACRAQALARGESFGVWGGVDMAPGYKARTQASAVADMRPPTGMPARTWRHITSAEVEVMQSLRQEGLSYREIAARLGTTVPRVGTALRRAGVPRPVAPEPAWWSRAVALHKAGRTQVQIAAQLSVTPRQVRYALGQRGHLRADSQGAASAA